MPGDFVPLAVQRSSDESDSFRVKVVPRAAAPEKFVPVIPPAAGREAHPCGSAGPGSAGRPGEPAMEVLRDGDRVTGLRIRCACGEVIEVACVY